MSSLLLFTTSRLDEVIVSVEEQSFFLSRLPVPIQKQSDVACSSDDLLRSPATGLPIAAERFQEGLSLSEPPGSAFPHIAAGCRTDTLTSH